MEELKKFFEKPYVHKKRDRSGLLANLINVISKKANRVSSTIGQMSRGLKYNLSLFPTF